MDLKRLLRVLRRRWITSAVTSALVLAAVVAVTTFQTPMYQATNRVFVQPEAAAFASELNSGVTFAGQQITTYVDLATTPLVLAPVIDRLQLEQSPAELAEAISTSVPPDTLILDITATSSDPELAAAIANATSDSLREQIAALESDGQGSPVALTVISPAIAPAEPTSPKPAQNLAVGIVVALLAGIVAAAVREVIDSRVRIPEDVARDLEVPVIGTIPAGRDDGEMSMIAVRDPQGPQSEAYRDLRTNLQFMAVSGGEKSVLFTSALRGEGKSSTASNIAHVLAQSGVRVLLIDADLRKPSLADAFGLERGAGLSTILIGEATLDEVVQSSTTSGPDVLTSGPIPPNPSELLGTKRMERALERAAESYEAVIIDTAPLLAVTDAVVLSRIVGGTVVVARSQHVRRAQLRHGLAKLQSVDARLLGVVVNRLHRGADSAHRYYTYESDREHHLPVTLAEATPAPRPLRNTGGALGATLQLSGRSATDGLMHGRRRRTTLHRPADLRSRDDARDDSP